MKEPHDFELLRNELEDFDDDFSWDKRYRTNLKERIMTAIDNRPEERKRARFIMSALKVTGLAAVCFFIISLVIQDSDSFNNPFLIAQLDEIDKDNNVEITAPEEEALPYELTSFTDETKALIIQYMVINYMAAETSQLLKYDEKFDHFIWKREVTDNYAEILASNRHSLLAIDEDELILHYLMGNTKKVLFNLKEDIEKGAEDTLSGFRLSPSETQVFFEKQTTDLNGVFIRSQIFSYHLENGEEIQWTSDEAYSYLSPFATEEGLYVLGNQSHLPKNLYYIPCPKCTPERVNIEAVAAKRFLDIDENKRIAFIETEDTSGIVSLVAVSLDTGQTTVLLEDTDILTVVSKDGIIVERERANHYEPFRYTFRNLNNLDETVMLIFHLDGGVGFSGETRDREFLNFGD